MTQIMIDKCEQSDRLLQKKKQADELRTVDFFCCQHLVWYSGFMFSSRKRENVQTQHRHRVPVYAESFAAADEELQ